MPATMKSPAVGEIDRVGVELLPEVAEVESTPAMPDTSDTTNCPSTLPLSPAVTVVAPDVPVEENPAQISAEPPPDVPKPVTACQLTPPPVTVEASSPVPLRVASVRTMATRAS